MPSWIALPLLMLIAGVISAVFLYVDMAFYRWALQILGINRRNR